MAGFGVENVPMLKERRRTRGMKLSNADDNFSYRIRKRNTGRRKYCCGGDVESRTGPPMLGFANRINKYRCSR
jgi:hypothetical protein